MSAGRACGILINVNPLRNPNINYFKGWFFVTFQVAMNKSVFGVISDKKLILNALGEMVRENLLGLGRVFPELYIDTVMVMPNHVHVVLKIDSHDEKKDLTYFIGRFKSFTTNQYHKLVKAGECVDLGPRLWADNYYDNLVSSHQELINVRNYTLKNPERWEDDRFGAVTSFSVGNLELLSSSLVAFVASDTHDKWGDEKPHVRAVREVSRTEAGDARYKAEAGDARYKAEAGEARYKAEAGDARYKAEAGEARYKANLKELPLVSTFSSFEEQGALARRLEAKRPFVWVDPAGIKANLPAPVKAACDEGWGLVISPVASGTGLNKQRAIWCNRWVLKVAERIYVGTIKKGGTLDTLLNSYRG